MPNTIFYVDDDRDDLEIFGAVAQELQLKAMLFDDGHLLLDAMQSPPIHPTVVFIDLNMPKISGCDVLNKLNERNFKGCVPVILTTASDHNTIEKCRKLGARMFVRKPNSIQKLKATIKGIASIKWDEYSTDGERFIFEA